MHASKCKRFFLLSVESENQNQKISKTEIQSDAYMDKLSKVVKSESVSSYLSCYSTDDDRNFRRERTKIFTNTKSRLLMHYNADSSAFKKNVRKLKLAKSFEQSPETSSTTIRALQQRQMLERHQLIKERFGEKLPFTKYTKQTRDNEPFDASRLRILSNREITTSIRKTSTRIERRSIAQRPVLWQNRGQNSQSTNGEIYTSKASETQWND